MTNTTPSTRMRLTKMNPSSDLAIFSNTCGTAEISWISRFASCTTHKPVSRHIREEISCESSSPIDGLFSLGRERERERKSLLIDNSRFSFHDAVI